MLDSNKVTDKLKRAAITFAIVVIAQLLLAGPAATAAWWGATAELVSNGAARMSSVVDMVGNGVDGTPLDTAP